MLYGLGHPVAFFGLLVGFLVGVTAHGAAQAWLARRLAGRAAGGFGRARLDPRRHLDPFGAIGAALAGVGWAAPVEGSSRTLRGRGRLIAVLLAGPAANLGLAVTGIGGYLLAGGSRALLDAVPLVDSVHGSVRLPSAGQTALLLFGVENLAMALLSLVPLPPLEGGRLLFELGPRTSGWRRAEYELSEHNWGLIAVLVLLVLPLGGGSPLLLSLIDAVGGPLLGLAAGGTS